MSKRHAQNCSHFLCDIAFHCVKPLGTCLKCKPFRKGLSWSTKVLVKVCPLPEVGASSFIGNVLLAWVRGIEKWQPLSNDRVPDLGTNPNGFCQEKHVMSDITSLAAIAPFPCNIGEVISTAAAEKSCLSGMLDGWAYEMSSLSLIDNGKKSKAIICEIRSLLRCCWTSAGKDSFPYKHFR